MPADDVDGLAEHAFTSATQFAGPTLAGGATGVRGRPASESALSPKTTKVTSLLPMVVSPPIVVKPADLVRRVPPTTLMNPTASTDVDIKRAR